VRARRLVSGMLYTTPIMCQNQKAEKLKYNEIASLPGRQPEGDEGWLSMVGLHLNPLQRRTFSPVKNYGCTHDGFNSSGAKVMHFRETLLGPEKMVMIILASHFRKMDIKGPGTFQYGMPRDWISPLKL
jgi:hypothetical protein